MFALILILILSYIAIGGITLSICNHLSMDDLEEAQYHVALLWPIVMIFLLCSASSFVTTKVIKRVLGNKLKGIM